MSPQFGLGSLLLVSLICLMGMTPVASGMDGSQMASAVFDTLFNLGYNRL